MEEIKAADLMIGSWVIYNDDLFQEDHIVKILGICEPFLTSPLQILYENREVRGASHNLNNIKTIPLTEEILLKCGAKRIEDDHVSLMLNDPSTHLILMKIGTHWYPQIEQTGEFISDGVNTVHLIFIDYVHQAQNLFKSLTGNDLKVEI